MALKPFVLWGIEDDFGTGMQTVILMLLWTLVASERLCISSGFCSRSLRWERVSLRRQRPFVLSHTGEGASGAAAPSCIPGLASVGLVISVLGEAL